MSSKQIEELKKRKQEFDATMAQLQKRQKEAIQKYVRKLEEIKIKQLKDSLDI